MGTLWIKSVLSIGIAGEATVTLGDLLPSREFCVAHLDFSNELYVARTLIA